MRSDLINSKQMRLSVGASRSGPFDAPLGTEVIGLEERLVDICSSLMADAQSPETMKLSKSSLHDPTPSTEPLDALPNACSHPFVKATPARHPATAAAFPRQVLPWYSGFENEQNPG